MKYPHIARTVFGVPWAIERSAMERVVAVMDLRMSGVKIDMAEVQEQLAIAAASAGPRAGAQGGQVAVIPMYGILSYRMNMMTAMSGGTSVQQLQQAFRQALGDPTVSAIVFDVDSPGGAVDGIPEFASEIRAARGQKPMIAVANKMIASAAYWLAAQCDEIVAGPSSWLGSIGVLAVHEDDSAANEQMGVKYTYITAGKYKAEGNHNQPISPEAASYVQGEVDKTYARFVGAVAKGRGVAASVVRGEAFGEGRMKSGEDAVSSGMADVLDTIDPMSAAFGRIARGKIAMRAETDPYRLVTDTTAGDASLVVSLFVDGRIVEPAATGPDQSTIIALAKARARRRRAIPA